MESISPVLSRSYSALLMTTTFTLVFLKYVLYLFFFSLKITFVCNSPKLCAKVYLGTGKKSLHVLNWFEGNKVMNCHLKLRYGFIQEKSHTYIIVLHFI